jgi:hypothetical protein
MGKQLLQFLMKYNPATLENLLKMSKGAGALAKESYGMAKMNPKGAAGIGGAGMLGGMGLSHLMNRGNPDEDEAARRQEQMKALLPYLLEAGQ